MRPYLYSVLEQASSSSLARLVNLLLMLLIMCNVMAVILSSNRAIYVELQTFFDLFEWISVGIFTVEYLLRAWVCVDDPRYQSTVKGRLKYLFSPMAIIDLVAIAPFYLGMFFNIDTRLLRVIRLFRIFKLSRHFSVMSVMLSVVKTETPALASAIFIMMVLIVLSSAGIFIVEHKVQPETFGTIPRAMWWAAITLSTVGYGDVVPITAGGKAFGIFITVLGVGMAALPAGIITAGFSREMNRRYETYRGMVRDALMDGEIDIDERRQLEESSEDMGIGKYDAMRLIRQESGPGFVPVTAGCCPHCGKSLSSVSKK